MPFSLAMCAAVIERVDHACWFPQMQSLEKSWSEEQKDLKAKLERLQKVSTMFNLLY